MKKYLLSLVLVLCTIFVFSQDIYIPDRPGFTYNAHNVGVHQMDIEMGFGYNYSNYGEKSNLFYNTTAIRYGAFKFLEFRYEIDFGNLTTPTYKESGVRGITVGFKAPIYINDSIISVSIVGGCYLPNLGKLTVRTPDSLPSLFEIPNYSPSLNLVLQKTIGKFTLLANTGVIWNGYNPNINNFITTQGTSSFAIYYFPSKFGFMCETFCMYSNGLNPVNIGDVGIMYCLTDDLIFDLSAGMNYVKGFDDSYINAGIAWRIPNKHK